MNIHILSRDEAQKWKSVNEDGTSVLIRVLEPRNYEHNLILASPNRFSDVIEVFVDDVTQEAYNERLIGSNFVVYSDSDADTVSDFIWSNKDVDDLVIHCHGGISRSSGIALAVAEVFNLVDVLEHIETSRRYVPNQTVYERTKKALMKIVKKENNFEK